MKTRLYTIWTVLLIALVTVTPVFAGNIKLSGSFSAGSIHFDGFATGVGGFDGTTYELIGFGVPVVTCTNQGGNDAPGQNPSQISVDGYTYISPDDYFDTTVKGKTPVRVIADESGIVLSGTQGGCPNDNWTATIDSIEWFGAMINVYNGDTVDPAAMIKTFNYTCDPSLKDGNNLYCTLESTITY